MLRFFRKIRKSLLDSSSVRKYLLYAMGEIMLVMIGILLALQVNNWNEWRKDRIKEKAHLQEIAATAESNILLLGNRIRRINNRSRSGDLVYTYLTTRDSSLEIKPEDWHWALMGHGDLTLSSSGYESLKSQGFDLLTNIELKSQIVNLFENSYQKLVSEQEWSKSIRPDQDKFTIEHFSTNKDENGKSIFGKIPRDKSFLLDNYYFHGLIEAAIGQGSFYLRRFQNTMDETEHVLQQIKHELNKKR